MIRTFLSITILAELHFYAKRKARSAYRFVGKQPGSLSKALRDLQDAQSTSSPYRNPIYLAQEWNDALTTGAYPSQAQLAQRLGLSRARVSQVLSLLRLSPEVLKAVAGLGDPLPGPIVTERALRPLVKLPSEEQKRSATGAIDDLHL